MAKLNYAPLENYLEEQKKKTAATDSGQAMSYYRNIASGTPSSGLVAAQSATREALARQAASMRGQASQTLAKGGSLGQGESVKGMQATEQGILQTLADSRNKEMQAISAEQAGANETLLGQSNADRSSALNALQMGLASEDAALKASTVRGLKEYLANSGVQMPTDESYLAYNEEAAKTSEQDPTAQLEKMTAEKALNAAKAAKIISSGPGGAASIVQAHYVDPDTAYQAFVSNLNEPALFDQRFWLNNIAPLLAAGNKDAATKMLSDYLSKRSAPRNRITDRQFENLANAKVTV